MSIDSRQDSRQSEQPEQTDSERIGIVLGTEHTTPTAFWFSVSEGASVGLDDLVVVETKKTDGNLISFYGLVDHVRKKHEGVAFESDVEDVLAGVLPAAISYTARVLVTRIYPEQFVPPQPGDIVKRATGRALEIALSADKMKTAAFPAGLLTNGEIAFLNYKFVNGDSGGHINISGISGIATKTSYALFLLYSIFNSGVMDRVSQASGGKSVGSAGGKAIIFNVKGEDLLFLDKPNKNMPEEEDKVQKAKGFPKTRYQLLGLEAKPFDSVQFLAPPHPKSSGSSIVPDVQQRYEGVVPFFYTIREFCLRRMLPFAFSSRDISLNVSFVIDNVTEKLYQLASFDNTNANQSFLQVTDWQPTEDSNNYDEDINEDELNSGKIKSFGQLVAYIDYKLTAANDEKVGDPRWVANQTSGTLGAFVRRLRGVKQHLSPLVRGDVEADKAAQYAPDVTKSFSQVTVVDINNLSSHAQMFVVGVMLQQIFAYKEEIGRQNTFFVVLDELNKYAPRDGDSPIKDILLEIAERGRSLGILLIGAQQTASEVERRIVSNAAVRVVGRLDLAEAERSEYRFLPSSFRERAGILQPGTMLISQPDIPNPLLVNVPFPAWATRRDEVDESSSKTREEQMRDLLE